MVYFLRPTRHYHITILTFFKVILKKDEYKLYSVRHDPVRLRYAYLHI